MLLHFMLTLEQNHVSHNSKLKVFTVLGSEKKPYAVCLFPSEYCSCPATKSCYHITAAKLSIGIPISPKESKENRS